MKKQFFLLSLMLVAFNASMLVADSCSSSCSVSCATSCSSSSDSCSSSNCVPEHGHTFMALPAEFAGASPERVSLFESSRLKNLKHNDKHGEFQVVVYGGKNTRGHQAAGYYLPYGHTQLTFDGSINAGTFASVLAETDVLVVGATTAQVMPATNAGTGYVPGTELTTGGNYAVNGNTRLAVDPATYQFDLNKDTSKILPWNFGITFAALFEPRGASKIGAQVGTGLITAPAFNSTINPSLRRWHVGAGLEFTYHFSDEVDGWYGRISTAVQHVRSKINLHEDVVTQKDFLDDVYATDNVANPSGSAITNQPAAFEPATASAPAPTTAIAAGSPWLSQVIGSNGLDYNLNPDGTPANGVAVVAPVGSVALAYLGYNGTTYNATGFPIDIAGTATTSSSDVDVIAPANVTQAFNQAAWNYGKIGCDSKITRLADIELSIGRLWTCGDCASTSWEVGVVIPTGNKPHAEYVAPAVVGNGQHAALRLGSTTSIMLSECDNSSTWFRIDTDSRYLFRNTQKRSFDVKGKEWSRYMMVWANQDAYTAAVTALAAPLADFDAMLPQRTYTPGINVFTTDFYVKPEFQGRFNSAVVMCGERFKAEFGWNVHARTRECVELACSWDAAPAFADSSYLGGIGLNNNRTIYNDSQTTTVNAVDSVGRGYTMANMPLTGITTGAQTDGSFLVTPTGTQDANVAAVAALYSNFALGEDDINYDSASTPGSISHTPYLTLGCSFDCDWSPVVAIGASYEFNAGNKTLNQWMVWGKFECAF